MSVEGQSETSALDLGVAASTLKPDNPAPEKRGLTLQLGLQKGSKPHGRDAPRLGSREPGPALAGRTNGREDLGLEALEISSGAFVCAT